MESNADVRVLGPLRVQVDGEEVQLGGPRPRLLFALLAVAGGRSISMGRLIDDLYGDDPPATARKSIQVHVSNLRRALDPLEAILTTADGYRLDPDVLDIDALAFEQAVDGAIARVETEPAAASTSLSAALARWQGPPFGDLGTEPALRPDAARLTELRLRALEVRIETQLRMGAHADVLGDLEVLTREHPFREEFRAQQMLALYRAGRQAEALRVFDRTRQQLVEELGIEPTARLRELHLAVLEQDPSLDLAPTTVVRDGAGGPTTLRGYELREVLGHGPTGSVHRAYHAATGREVVVRIVRPDLANQPDFVRRFDAEARAVAGLSHPWVAPILDHWRDPDGAYVVLPLFTGGSLADRLAAGPLDPSAALRVVDLVGSALAHAHRQGIVHGNCKPSNVLLDADGEPHLTDFLVAGDVTDADPATAPYAYAAPERLAGEPIDVRSDVYDLTLLLHETLSGTRAGLGETQLRLDHRRLGTPPDLDTVLARGAARAPADRYARVEDLLRAVRRAFGVDMAPRSAREPASGQRNPFKGLRAFGEGDAADFHGRATVVEQLLAALGSWDVVTLVGPSGTGKSSVVRAGLLPAVRSGALRSGTQWLVADMFPGAHPFEELEAALLGVAADRPDRLLELLTDDPRGLVRVAKRVLPDEDTSLLLVIDQFEEVFALVQSETTRERFLASMVEVARDARSRLKIVLTLRADFFDRPLQHPDFGAVVEQAVVPVSMPSEESLAMAIARPARAVGLELEPGLVPAMIADVVGEPGGLPLLQYSCTELVEHRRGDELTLAAYEELGRAGGALARRAEQIHASLSPAGQAAARDVFLRLVAVSTESEDTRRRIALHQLTSMAPDPGAIELVIEQFGAHRLLTFDHDPVTRAPTVEVAHEALISRWPRYRGWIDDRRGDLLAERRLEAAALEWDEEDREPGFLLRGERLEHYDAWASATELPLTTVMRDYLAESRALAADVAAAETANQHRAAALRRRSRLLVASAVAAVVLLVVAVGAWMGRNAAEERAAEADVVTRDAALAEEAARLAGLATEAVATDPGLAASLAVAGVLATADSGEVEPAVVDALHWALQDGGETFATTATTAVAVRPSPEGLRGVFVLPVDDLVTMAQAGLVRPFTAAACAAHFTDAPCPDPTGPVPTGLEVSGGLEAYRALTEPDAPLTGTSVNLTSWLPDSDLVGQPVADAILLEALGRATTGAGITITHDQVDVLSPDVFTQDRAEVDIIIAQERSFLTWAAATGELHDLTAILDVEALAARYGEQLTAHVRGEDGGLYGVPYSLFARSLVTYNKDAFAAMGYQVPTSWDELVALSDQARADGFAPWCWAGKWLAEPGGFPVADWLGSLALAEYGPQVTHDLGRGALPFDSPEGRSAFARLGELTFTDGYSLVPPDAIPDTDFFLPVFDLAAAEPGCLLLLGTTIPVTVLPSQEQLDRLDVFPLPPVGGGDPHLLVGVNTAMLAVDSPENRRVIEAFADPTFLRSHVDASTGFTPADPTIDTTASDPLYLQRQPLPVHARIIEVGQTATREGRLVFGPGDLLPLDALRTLWTAPVAWYRSGGGDLDGVLQEIDGAVSAATR